MRNWKMLSNLFWVCLCSRVVNPILVKDGITSQKKLEQDECVLGVDSGKLLNHGLPFPTPT